VEENDAKVLVFSRALREKKEPRVKSLSLLSKWGIILLLLLLSMMTRRDDVARHTRSKGTIIKEKETYRSYDERSVILRGNKHNLCVCVFVGMLFSSTKISTSSLHLWLR
jgi:hypothetical protein